MVAAQDVADRGGRDEQTEFGAFAFDAQVSPAGIFPGETEHRVDDLGVKTGPLLAVARVGPVSGYEMAMQAQQRGWCDLSTGAKITSQIGAAVYLGLIV
jgi:hypothetical protein